MTAHGMAAALAGPPDRAAALLRAGAEAGLPEAQAAYGQILLDGQGVAADPVAALRWFGLAARAGNLMAVNMVGRCHEKGWGTAPDPVEAARRYRIAAEGGLDWGMYNYAGALGLGAGVARDEMAALGWFQRAASLGHAKSINMVGTIAEEGRLVRRDIGKAAECFARAAQGGDFRGQFNHARLLAGAGDIEAALGWIARAAETATPAFRARMREWLAAAPLPALRDAAGTIAA
ncbi:MAG TPA: tetratricopeptide repeat protein [Sphingomonas sp.]